MTYGSSTPGSLSPLSLAHFIHHAAKAGVSTPLPSLESGLIKRLALAKGKLAKLSPAEAKRHLLVCWSLSSLAALGTLSLQYEAAETNILGDERPHGAGPSHPSRSSLLPPALQPLDAGVRPSWSNQSQPSGPDSKTPADIQHQKK